MHETGGALMYRLADEMDAHREELATLETLDSGAVYTLALKTHIGMSIDTFRYFAGWCDKIHVRSILIISISTLFFQYFLVELRCICEATDTRVSLSQGGFIIVCTLCSFDGKIPFVAVTLYYNTIGRE